MGMQDLKPFRVFLEVAQHESFVAAARALRMTPATVTRVVAQLERELGQQLFVRTTRQVSVTSFGEALRQRYAPVIAEFDRITEDVRRATRPDQGRLRISAPISLGVRLLPGVVDSFSIAFPGIALDIRMTDSLIDIIEEPVDLAIRVSGPPEDKSTIWRKICEIPRQLVAAPQLFSRCPTPGEPGELLREFCLSYGKAPETWLLRNGEDAVSVRAGDKVISDSGDFLYELALKGTGIAQLPNFITENALSEGTLVSVVPNWQPSPLWLTLYYPPYQTLPPLVATFSDFFEDYVREMGRVSFLYDDA